MEGRACIESLGAGRRWGPGDSEGGSLAGRSQEGANRETKNETESESQREVRDQSAAFRVRKRASFLRANKLSAGHNGSRDRKRKKERVGGSTGIAKVEPGKVACAAPQNLLLFWGGGTGRWLLQGALKPWRSS